MTRDSSKHNSSCDLLQMKKYNGRNDQSVKTANFNNFLANFVKLSIIFFHVVVRKTSSSIGLVVCTTLIPYLEHLFWRWNTLTQRVVHRCSAIISARKYLEKIKYRENNILPTYGVVKWKLIIAIGRHSNQRKSCRKTLRRSEMTL